MKTIEIGDALESLGKYVGRRRNLPLVVTNHGRPIAAVLAVPNADMETVSLSTNPRFLALINRARARHDKEGGVASEEMRRRLRQ